MKKTYKKILAAFLLITAVYFILGLIFSYNFGYSNYWNVLFDMDTQRAFGDLTIADYNHYRATVHPLFVIMFQPLCRTLGYIFSDKVLACLLVQSCFSSISLLSVHKILEKFGLGKKTNIFLTILFGTSLGQVAFTSSIETYIFAQFIMALMWLFAAFKMDKELKLWDYIILTLFGVGCVGVTLTNVFQFIIVLFVLVTLNKKVKNRIILTIVVGMSALSLSVLLACVQNIVWPSAPNYFTKNITDFLYGTSEENLYIDKSITSRKFVNIANALFGYSFNVTSVHIPKTGVYLTFVQSLFTEIFSIIMAVIFFILNLWYIIKTKFNILKDKLYYALLVALGFNLVLHLFYGNQSTFLYICHFNFLLIIIIGYLLSKLKINVFEKKPVFYGLIGIMIVLCIRILIMMFTAFVPRFTPVEHFRILPFFIILVFLVAGISLLFKRNTYKIILSVIVAGLLCGTYFIVNYKPVQKECNIFCEYTKYYDEYIKQLKDLKNTFMVASYEDTKDPIGVYYFGMADREKMVYKDGKLYEALTGKVIREFKYDKEFIVPNMYTVLLNNGNDIYKIYENETGVYLDINGKVETLTTGKKINLPNYEGKKFSEVLKVLHQEVLFNIAGSEPKPNIWAYPQAYYRDAMVVTMVLENTDNVNLIKPWASSITKIYDNSRSKDIDEVDNLGELLYILGATNTKNDALAQKIVKEINRLKDNKKHISGTVNFEHQTYYPTALAILGAEKYGVSIDLEYPEVDDDYGKLTWYSDHKVESYLVQNQHYYPYLNWGFLHYSGYGSVYILDETYPLTYEGGMDLENIRQENECYMSEFYCERDLFLSHSWTASEIYFAILDY